VRFLLYFGAQQNANTNTHPTMSGCCSACYATRCLADCCVVSFCCPCRWCCDLPQTYEESYEWQLVTDDVNQLERDYQTMMVRKEAEAKEDRHFAAWKKARVDESNRRWRFALHEHDVAEEETRIMAAQATRTPRSTDETDESIIRGSRSWRSRRGIKKTLSAGMSSLASRSFQSQSRDDQGDSDWDHSVDTAARDNTSATLRRRLGARFASPTRTNPDAIEATRDGVVDPILSGRSDYEKQLS